MASYCTRSSVKRQSSPLPKPQSPNREDNPPTKDVLEKHSNEENVFSAVAGEKPNEAENMDSKKEAAKDSLDGDRERDNLLDLNQPLDQENDQGPRRSSRERRMNSHLRGYELKF